MEILGAVLTIIGGIWIIGNTFLRPRLFEILNLSVKRVGLKRALGNHLSVELVLGLGPGIAMAGLGIYLFRPASLQTFLIAIGILLSLLFLWGSIKLNAAPFGLIAILAVGGFIFKGWPGLLVGFAAGWVIAMLLGLFVTIVSRLFKIWPIKKQARANMARDFLGMNELEISNLPRFHAKSQKEIVEILSKNINRICEEVMRLREPRKSHRYDLDFLAFEENFTRGASNWLKKFEDEAERQAMEKFVYFLLNTIYRTGRNHP